VQQEDIASKLTGITRPYVDAVAVFSLRDGDLLRASLQVSRFNRLAKPGSSAFVGSIVNEIGGSAYQVYHVRDTDVYATTASDQVVFVWFRHRGMFVLAIQKQFSFPRTLLRRLLQSDVGV
jgi:hypothetical protein